MNAAIDKEAEAQALMQLSRQWSDLVASGDMEAALDYWADDAVLLPPDLPVLSGKAAIREYVMGAADIPGFRISWEPERAFISDNGDMALGLITHIDSLISLDHCTGRRRRRHSLII